WPFPPAKEERFFLSSYRCSRIALCFSPFIFEFRANSSDVASFRPAVNSRFYSYDERRSAISTNGFLFVVSSGKEIVFVEHRPNLGLALPLCHMASISAFGGGPEFSADFTSIMNRMRISPLRGSIL